MKKHCLRCGEQIPEGRLKALPNTTTCTACSSTNRTKGFMSYDHKTAPVLNLCDNEQAEEVYAKTRRRGQGVLPGIRMKGH